jgi:fibronectin type 3 domain-containing protein
VTGTSNTAVTWLLNPVVGTITSAGVYTAPASISSSQNVNIIATSAADTTKTATVAVSLQPTVSVGVSPTGATLAGSQTKQFKATVTGTSNTAVTWSLNPAVGTVSSTGLYTAPGSISSSQNVNIIATSSADSTKTATAIVSLQRPAAPANLVATPASTSSIGLTWSAAASGGLPVQNYHVYRGTTASNLSQLAIVSQTSYTDSTVTAAAKYYYAVAAADTAADLSPMSAIVTATVPSVPSAPTGLLATPVSTTKTSLTWSVPASRGLPIQNYRVFRGTTGSNLSQVATVAQPAYTDASGSQATRYYYGVEAADTSGNVSLMSAIVPFTTPRTPAAPANLVVTAAATSRIGLTWSAAASGGLPVQYYQVFRGSSASNLSQVAVVTQTSYTDTSVNPAVTYYYAVQAADTGADLSPMSAIVSAETQAQQVINVLDFGIDNTGVTDVAVSLNALIATVGANAELVFPCGGYNIHNGTIYVSVSGITLRSESPGCAVFTYDTLTYGMLVYGATRGSTVSDITIDGLAFDSSAASSLSVAGRGSLYIGSNGVFSNANNIYIHAVTVRETGTSAFVVGNGASNVWIDDVQVDQAGEHCLYQSARDKIYITNATLRNPCTSVGGTMTQCAGLKVALGSGLTSITDPIVTLGASTNNEAYVLYDPPTGNVTLASPQAILGAANDIGIRITSGGADGGNNVTISAPHVDGGSGYSNATAIYIDGGTNNTVLGGVITGTWPSSPIQIRTGSTNARFVGTTIESVAPGRYAVQMTAPKGPILDGVQILSAQYGVELGTSNGATLTNMINSASVVQYDFSGPPTNYTISP